MIKHNEELLGLLKEAYDLAEEQQRKTGTNNLDVMHIRGAMEVVAMRIKFLKAEQSKSSQRADPTKPE